ncbi:amino acid adenylation domain-containing protein [Tenacibaculum sp. MAR_2009_124]|uniref:non-ribosomal peptide synthetase n=1 Tax=Tenacibaculum sp. MAR_2009_124 TaxID=1250059 RepID=UPI000897D981|nr:non-ribosomal peptide synthetase [Tenacibaculum sp. MAR_2009_124]SEC23103.1 amino acid adenylation domain-containing protein [Tenacibaculum sp. MAR_2009_124]
MDITIFFRKLYKEGIKLVLKDGSLNIKADAEINPEIITEIRNNKELIINYLKAYEEDTSSESLLEKITPYNKEELEQIPLSFGQERLWFLQQMNGSSEEYHINTVIRLEGDLDVKILEETLKTIVSRHEVLRTVIYEEEGIGYQKVIPVNDWSLQKVVTSEQTNLEKEVHDFMNITFDLSKDYMLRCGLYDLGKNKYVLACVFHHIASDGWSSGILTNEFITIYSALKSGQKTHFPELSLQYSDYALWQRTYFEKEILEDQLTYWEEKLKDSSSLVLPFDYPRPSIQSTAGATLFVDLDEKLTSSLNALAKEEGVTLFMLLLAAFKVLLSRYSGQQDISIGTPIANRTQSDLEEMIGFFVNTLVLRSDLSGNPSFKEFLSQVKQTTLKSYDHQLAPFEKVVDRVVKTRDTSSSALFQVMFTLQNTPSSSTDITIEDVTISGYEFNDDKSEFDLTLDVSEEEGEITLSLTYCTALFKEETVNRMMVHYQELLTSIVNNNNLPINDLQMLTEKEEVQILKAFNATKVSFPTNQTVVDLFEAQVEKTPDSIAALFESTSLSYKELNERSNQLAHYLKTQGVQSDTLVGICLERSNDMIVSILGILKSGGAYVPIDPNYPTSRIDYILEDTGIELLISSGNTSETSSDQHETKIISLTYDWKDISKLPTQNPQTISSTSHLAYVIYTSGSTGKPKGVAVTHGNLFSTLQGELKLLGSEQNLRSCLLTNYVFDVSLLELFLPLITGERIVIPNSKTGKDIPSLLHLLVSEKVTVLQGTPSFFSIFLTGLTSTISNSLSLELLCIGGESLTTSLVSEIQSLLPNVQINNHYGPTEITIDAIVATDIKEFTNNNIGSPMPNVESYIVDSYDGLVPLGVFGELYIGGNGVTKGYINRETLTAEKFINSPFKQGETLYKTGDLARWLPNGTIEYKGRKDNQVKVRGYRIELGEVEKSISALESVNQCCVLVKEDPSGNSLVAYVVTEGEFDKELLQAQLKEILPEYMIPMLWIELEEMPLTTNGKIDKKSLPEIDESLLLRRKYVAPRNETEEELVTIWQELLGLDKVGIYDNFFELGGHSLLVVQLISRIQKLDLHIEIKDVFTDATIAGISQRVTSLEEMYKVPENGITKTTERIIPSMVPLLDFEQEDLDLLVSQVEGGVSNIEDMYPLSPLQEGIYFHYLMSDKKSGDPYVLPHLLSFSDAEERKTFITALQFVTNRHDVLRTCVIGTGLPRAVQVVLREVPLTVEHLTIDNPENTLSELESLMAPGCQWLDVSKAPLLELKSADDPVNNNYYLIVNQHHLVMDHVGLEKIIFEVDQYLSGNKDILPKPVLYREFIGHTLHLQETNDSESYFKELLADIEDPTYPFNLSDIRGNGSDIKDSEIILSLELSRKIRSISIELGMSPAVIFHAAYGLVVGKCSNHNYALFGSLFSGRLQGSLGAENSLGLFINTLPFFVELKGTVLDYIEKVKQLLNGLLPYEQTPLSAIQNWSDISNEVPFFSALLNFRHSHDSSEEDDNDSIDDNSTAGFGETFIAGHERTNYPFTLNVDDFGELFGLSAQMDPSIEPDRILSYMQSILNEIIEEMSNEKAVTELTMLTKGEEVQLLEIFNDNKISYPQDKTIIDLFNDHVKRAPEAIALVYGEEIITFGELDELSNRFANYLLGTYEIKTETSIGVSLERSDWSIVSFLAILKTGGVYVPIDVYYPEERKDYIQKDSGAIFVIDDSVLEEFIENGEDYGAHKPNIEIKPNNLAYIIYTSGSTGKPKGVMIEHTSVINTLLTNINSFSITPESNCLQFANPSFDASIWEIGISLLSGASLYIIEEDRKSDTPLFKEFIQDNNITFAVLPPAFLQLLEVEDLKPLDTLVTGGEAIPLTVAKTFSKEYKYFNAYGPTEASICTTTFNGNIKSLVPIGKPINNMQVYILSEANELLPLGVIGELCVGGIGVARGYLNRDELTKEKFIDSPFKNGDRIYKTGDLAKWLPDGNIEFSGRKDDQVKIRGYRIEIGEIENVLSEISEIQSSCVLAKEDSIGNKRLVGYILPTEEYTKETVQEKLAARLPDYMIPSIWVTLDEMPLTNSGKIAKKLLPAPDGSLLSTVEYIAPRNEMEEQLATIWQELLGIEKVGIYDNFFELGGHSLLATRLVSMIRRELEVEIAIQNIFKFTTIDEIACYLEHKEHSLEDKEKEYSINIEI